MSLKKMSAERSKSVKVNEIRSFFRTHEGIVKIRFPIHFLWFTSVHKLKSKFIGFACMLRMLYV